MIKLDRDGLPTAADAERYHDILWRFSHAPEEKNTMLLERDDPATSPVKVQVSGSLRVHRGGDDSAENEPLRPEEALAIGRALRDSLPRDVAELPRRAPTPTRLRIAATGRAGSIPWELTVGADDTPLALDVRVVRHVPVRFPRPPTRAAGAIRVLVVISSPSLKKRLRVEDEYGTVAPVTSEYAVVRLDTPTTEQLRDRLHEHQPHIVHLVGHSATSHQNGFIVSSDEQGVAQWVDATTLASMLPSSVRLLCLDTPVTGRNYEIRGLIQMACAAAPLPTTITNLYDVTAPGAAAFWRAFHHAFAVEGNVVEAVQVARRHAATEVATVDWGSYVLHLRDGDAVLLDRRAMGTVTEPTGNDLATHFLVRLANDLAAASGSLAPAAADRVRLASSSAAREAVRYQQPAMDVPIGGDNDGGAR